MATRTSSRRPSVASFGAFARKPGRIEEAAEDTAEHTGDALADQGGEGVPDAPAPHDAQGSWPDDLIEVGAIGEAYGVRGWVKIYPHASVGHDAGSDQGNSGGDSALLAAKRWWLSRGPERRIAEVLTAKRHSGTVVAQLAGSGDRNAGEALKGYRVQVRRVDFPRLGADEFYWVDLIGLDVVNQDGIGLGTVADLIDNGAHSILRVESLTVDGEDGKPVKGERLIPFVDVYVKHVDQTARKIVVDWETDY
jgi:16S rRNA processing protein RimM